MRDDDLLIIGFGNPLRGDDGLGWRAAERLAAEARPGRHAIACQELTPDLAEPLSRAARAVFIDATIDGEPGMIVVSELRASPPQAGAFSHHLDPAGLLALAATWYGHAPQAELITVAGAHFDHSEDLSPGAQVALKSLLKLVNAL
jgi:hydrogenase maturation protease